ncbi:hypothetical protein NLI96_g11744 [Meripilus lineatus]|uniref:Uncharacterized protein n=1 Tax=Meripilus lineatus TaxID=2056292 RepID=A0AAD5YD17_9APHY|nr:hypothetical protein NLI96_g11744 [Physisporinus lineatus]
MNYARTTWSEELASWRIVIQLNLLRNVHTILDLLSQEMDSPSSAGDYDDLSDDESIASPLGIEPSPIIATTSGPSTSPSGSGIGSGSGSGSGSGGNNNNNSGGRPPRTPLNFTEKHRILKLELLPLRRVQTDLEQLLGASSQEEKSFSGGTSVMGFGSSSFDPSSSSSSAPTSSSTGPGSHNLSKSRGNSQELFVRSNNGWKANFRPGRQSTSSDNAARAEYGMVRRNKDATARETVEIIAGCAEGIRSLWADEVVQEIVEEEEGEVGDYAGVVSPFLLFSSGFGEVFGWRFGRVLTLLL